jgi:hypothetical protein
VTPHTASDFTADPAELGWECQRIAARLALQGRYQLAIGEYRASIDHFRRSNSWVTAERIAFANAELVRLDGLVAGGSR